MESKKAQITVAVVIGVVLLLVVGIALFIRSELTKNLPPEEQFTEQVPVEVQPIKNYLQDCLGSLTQDAAVRVGLHGGYSYPADFGLEERASPTSSPGVNFVPGTDTFIPYWFYMSSAQSCTTCDFSSGRLPLEGEDRSVEQQLAQYIADHLDTCTAGLQTFEDKGFSITTDEPRAVFAIIGPDTVSAFLDMDVVVRTTTGQETLSKFQASQEVPLGVMYSIATNITQDLAISNNKLFERATREFIDGYSIGDHPPIPPTSGPIEVGFSAPLTWTLSQTQARLQDLLAENIPFIQIEGSRNMRAYVSDNDFANTVYNRLRVPLEGVDPVVLNHYQVDFVYLPWWEPYLDIQPSSGELIRPDVTTVGFPIPLQIKQYNYAYDLSYPVVVSITDPDALGGAGYTFQFALEVNVRNNEPIEDTNLTIDALSVQDSSLFDDPANQYSGQVTIKSFDYDGMQPLEDVVLSYQCGDESVFLGVTQQDGTQAALTTRLPFCIGGVIVAAKEGFVADPYPFSPQRGKDASFTINLYAEQTLSVQVKQRLIRKDLLSTEGTLFGLDWQLHPDTEADLDQDDQAVLFLTRQGPFGEDYYAVVNLDGTDLYGKTVTLVPGTYKVEGYVMRQFGEGYSTDEFVIPEREECYDTQPLNPFGGEECQTLPEMVFNTSLNLGGVQLDASTSGFVEITREDLQHSQVTFYMASANLDDISLLEDLDYIDRGAEYSTSNREDFLPRFID